MGRFGDQDLTFFGFITCPLDQVQDSCMMASGCVPFPSLGERRFLLPRVFIMCSSARLLQSTPSIPLLSAWF